MFIKIPIRKTTILIIAFYLLSIPFSNAQIKLSLQQAIQLAQKNSLDYKISTNLAQSYYWNYQAYKSSLLPKLAFNGTLPDYYRTINIITLPNGQNNFVSQNVANSSLSLNLAQNIGLTGGSVSMSSSLRRINNFGNLKNTLYTSVPFSLNYSQRNLFYNEFKWLKRIEPLRLQEAQRGYLESLETISFNTIERYFDLLMADIQLKLDQQNLKNIESLVKTTQDRFEIGTVQLNDVLQSKVSHLNAKKAVANSTLLLQTTQQGLIRFLNLNKDHIIEPALPDSISYFDVSAEIALKQAMNNRKFIIEFQRRRIEAEQEIKKTKSLSGPTLALTTNLGLTQTGNSLNNTYEGLLRNQSVIVSFYIPVVDWGVNKSNRKRAEANFELEKNTIAQQELSAEQEIYYQTMKWSMQKEQMQIAHETSDMAQQRYNIARQKYSLGTLSYTDFNNAQLEKDRAILDYVNNLRSYWSSYYLIRRLTLFDFENNKKIDITDLKIN